MRLQTAKWPRNQPYGPKGRCLAHRICELAPLGAISTLKVALSRASLEEQTAIAAILSDMGAELAALEARRDKTRALKQGMMQALLTGRIRLAVVN